MKMKAHQAAELFPLLETPELDALAKDIKEHGLRHPIVTLGGVILDGRNRFRACEMADVKPRFETYKGKDPLDYIVSVNLARRHLDASQRAMVAARLKPMFEAAAQERMRAGVEDPVANLPEGGGRARDVAAAVVNVSSRGVESATKVLAEGAASVIAAVDAGKLAVSDAAKIVDRPKAEQRAAVKMVLAGEANTAVNALKQLDGEDEGEAPEGYSEADHEAEQAAGMAADYEAMCKIIDSDDRLVAAMAEVRIAKSLNATISGLYESKSQEVSILTKEAARWMRKAKKSAACPACKAALGAA